LRRDDEIQLALLALRKRVTMYWRHRADADARDRLREGISESASAADAPVMRGLSVVS